MPTETDVAVISGTAGTIIRLTDCGAIVLTWSQTKQLIEALQRELDKQKAPA